MNTDPIDIAIIINSCNRLSLLKVCLDSLESWLPFSEFSGRCIIVVYDAGSTDGSVAWLVEHIKTVNCSVDVIIPTQDEDTSFAGGLNTAVDFAISKFPLLQYLLFYETDNRIISEDPVRQALIMLERKSNLAGCGFTVKKYDENPAGIGQPFPSLLNFFLGKNIVNWFNLESVPYHWEKIADNLEFSEVDVVYTSPLLVRKKAWLQSGGMDARNFPFSDCDVDWAKRIHDLGWRLGVVRTNHVIHDNKEILSTWSEKRALQAHKGRLRYFFRYNPYSVFIIWPVFLILRHLLELMVTKLFVRSKERRKKLSLQYASLLKCCVKKYELG